MVLEPGCYIDCGHNTSHELNYRIIKFAADYGWDGGKSDISLLMSEYCDDSVLEENWEDLAEALYFAADDAVEWLNDNIATDDRWFDVYDNSLYYSEDESENV